MSALPITEADLAGRIDAVVAALKAYEMVMADNGPSLGEPWYIIGCLRVPEGPQINRKQLREWLDTILAVECARYWRTCWVRRSVGEIELVLGLPHDPRSAEAMVAVAAGPAAWKAYTGAERQADATEILAGAEGEA